MSRQLLLLIVETFVPAGACVDLVIDETLERSFGRKISKRGHDRDSALSSRERSVSSPGLRWIVMAVVVTLPWTKQKWALPFLCVLLDAVLHEPPPERTRHTSGRPRVGGLRLPALQQVLQDPETVWQKLTLDWYRKQTAT